MKPSCDLISILFAFHIDCQYGDPIQAEDDRGQRESFYLPASAGTAYCLDKNPAGIVIDPLFDCLVFTKLICCRY